MNCSGGLATGDSTSGGDPSYFLDGGMQISATTAGWLVGMGAATDVGSISYSGFNNGYAYTLSATVLGAGYSYFGVNYGTARFELGLPTDLGSLLGPASSASDSGGANDPTLRVYGEPAKCNATKNFPKGLPNTADLPSIDHTYLDGWTNFAYAQIANPPWPVGGYVASVKLKGSIGYAGQSAPSSSPLIPTQFTFPYLAWGSGSINWTVRIPSQHLNLKGVFNVTCK
jgi:hypothetical protein